MLRQTRAIQLTLLALLVLGGMMIVRAQAPVPPVATPRLVLCWYMVCYGNSVEGYKQEIALAQRHGIDGFVLDVGGWSGNYITSTERIYEAAKQLNSGFLLVMAPEYSAGPYDANFYDMVKRFANHPNQLKHDGKVVFSGYGGATMYGGALAKLRAEGIAVCLVPSVFLPRFVYNPSPEAFRAEITANALDGLMMFNAEEVGTVLALNSSARRATQQLGKICAAGVIPAYNSANLGDFHGLSGYLAMWQGAINDGADWVSIIIWNDYNEDSGLMPGHWPNGQLRYLYDRDESFLDATAYASAWFKSGTQPAITQDKIVVTYRTRSKWLRKGWNGKKWTDVSLDDDPYDQIHDDVRDVVYVDTFLTAPASLTVHLGEKAKAQRFELPAGIGHVEVPMVPGVPRLTLERNKNVLADVLGRKQIIDQPTPANSVRGYHAVNRTWTSGTVIGPVKRYDAAAGTLAAGAEVVNVGGVKAVKYTQTPGSGFTVPVAGLTTGTYNIRVTYANASAEEARLTLYADGPQRNPGEYPYFIPAFLPPTEKGKFQTVSFLWTLYDNTHALKLQWQPGIGWSGLDPSDNDHGSVLVQAIDLVKVNPVMPPASRDPALPELVPIPGGTFTMGSPKGEPDELPVHKVTVGGFAMGKYKVTNTEFERFDPMHRLFRDNNSWRDREPVVHVSWVDAAKYCNWLSAQHGLTPVYDETSWTADLKATGFRLPTEAEWEYEATGRGEGRTYAWGEAAPVPGVHGWFKGAAALDFRQPRSSTPEMGTVVVGSFPAGASRDGLLDMAGNAGEWCTDWYANYTPEAQTDPCQAKPGHFRVIRGGSWGWYGYSQRAADREFNSQNYPGHAYYGLRVAISAAGWQQLTAQKGTK